jgi:predicted transposase YbfD/YdcC
VETILLRLKGNQGSLRDFVEDYFMAAIENDFDAVFHDYFETTDAGHGRIEVRKHYTIDQFGDFPGKGAWKDLQTICMVVSERHIGDEVSIECRYHITSLPSNAKQFASSVRGHWGVENELHWCLDVGFREDDCRARKDHAPENFAVIRHIAMNLRKKEKSHKDQILQIFTNRAVVTQIVVLLQEPCETTVHQLFRLPGQSGGAGDSERRLPSIHSDSNSSIPCRSERLRKALLTERTGAGSWMNPWWSSFRNRLRAAMSLGRPASLRQFYSRQRSCEMRVGANPGERKSARESTRVRSLQSVGLE